MACPRCDGQTIQASQYSSRVRSIQPDILSLLFPSTLFHPPPLRSPGATNRASVTDRTKVVMTATDPNRFRYTPIRARETAMANDNIPNTARGSSGARRKSYAGLISTLGKYVFFLAFGALLGTAAAAAGKQPGDNTQTITVPFSAEGPSSEEASRHIYVLCLMHDSASVDTLMASCPKPLTQLNTTAPLKAGKKLLVVIDVPPKDKNNVATQCSDYSLTLSKKPVTPTDQNPIRGSQPTKSPSSNGNVASLLSDLVALNITAGEKYCYAVYPDPLTSDNYTTVSVTPPAGKGSGYPLPDIHTFYRFGVSTGLGVSTINNKTFAYTAGSTAAKYQTTTAGGSRLVEPIVFLTYYPFHGGLDSESKPRPDIGLVAGLSEKNPSSSYYLGISVEPIRYFALVVGANLYQETILDKNSFDPGPSSSHLTPSTRPSYHGGAFVAVNFNFSNFLQQVFK